MEPNLVLGSSTKVLVSARDTSLEAAHGFNPRQNSRASIRVTRTTACADIVGCPRSAWIGESSATAIAECRSLRIHEGANWLVEYQSFSPTRRTAAAPSASCLALASEVVL